MSNTVPSQEGLKAKAKTIRKFLKEKCGAEVSHSQCLELISQLFGFKDWNTASASSKSEVTKNDLPVWIKTVGGMRKALEPFKDSAKIEASSVLAIGAVLKSMDGLGLTEKSQFIDTYSFIVGETNDELVNLVLKLEDQQLEESNLPMADISIDDIEFLEL